MRILPIILILTLLSFSFVTASSINHNPCCVNQEYICRALDVHYDKVKDICIKDDMYLPLTAIEEGSMICLVRQ